MNKRVLVILIIFSGILLSAQSKVFFDTLQLFYKINEVSSAANSKRLDSLLNAIKGKPVKIKITGYADFLHTNNYNITLSQNRANAVRDYLQSKNVNGLMNFISCTGEGEKFSSDNNLKAGEYYQRRVDVFIEGVGAIESNRKTEADTDKKDIKPKEVVKSKQTKKNIEDLSLGESLAVEGLNFEPGRHFITKNSTPILEKLLKTLEVNKKLKIEIQGHVCCTDGEEDGLDYDTRERKLSENRARAIYEYLISKGISEKRLSYKGFGHSKPKFPLEATPQEEQANRRVEIMIIEK